MRPKIIPHRLSSEPSKDEHSSTEQEWDKIEQNWTVTVKLILSTPFKCMLILSGHWTVNWTSCRQTFFKRWHAIWHDRTQEMRCTGKTVSSSDNAFNQVSTSLGNSGLCWTVFARNRDTAVSAEGNGDCQTLICVLVARPRRCLTLSNPVHWQNWMAAYLGYTLQTRTLFRGWPIIMVNDTHTRRRRRRTLLIPELLLYDKLGLYRWWTGAKASLIMLWPHRVNRPVSTVN